MTFSRALEIMQAAEENRLNELKLLRYIHAMPDIIFALRCANTALNRKRQRNDELASIAADMRRIIALLSTPRC